MRIATASASGIEWFTAKYSQSHGPCRSRAPSATSSRCGVSRCSLHFSATSASVNRDPTTVRSGRWRSRNGTAPMWSSWPWVSTSASMSPSRSSIARKSGRIRSTPGESSLGNSTPQSTTSSRPSCSKTVMLRPTSPMPPRATTRRPPGRQGRRRPGGQLGRVDLLGLRGCGAARRRAGAGGDAGRRGSGPTGRAGHGVSSLTLVDVVPQGAVLNGDLAGSVTMPRLPIPRRRRGPHRPRPPPARGRARAGRRPPPGRP